MSRFFVILACMAFAAVCSAEYQTIQSVEADVEVVDNIKDFLAENPDIELTEMKVADFQQLNTIRYTYGRRSAGDRVVAQGNNNFNYPSPQNTRLNLNYPQGGGFGAVVTYVEINVDQSSNIGNAFIMSGGIGQRQITIVVEAKSTTRFSYRVIFFGF